MQSILWYVAVIGAVSLLYRRLMGGTWVAGLAALLYTVDDAHAMPAGWLANRNSLLAVLFGILAILAHDRWRRKAAERESSWLSPGAVVGPLLLALSLLSKEAGIATCAYLLAYALFLDHGAWRQRLVALLPYGVVVVVWRIVWTQMGYGVWGINLYVDPLTEPLRFLGAVMERAPIYLLGQWLFPPAETYLLASDLGVLICYSVVAVAIVLAILFIVMRTLPWDPATRFWFTGMMLSVLPICAAFPGDRVLCFVGLGAFGLLAKFLNAVFAPPAGSVSPAPSSGIERRADASGRFARTLGRLLVVVHLGLAPVVLAIHAAMPAGPPSFLEYLQVQLPMGPEVQRQSVIIVTAPIPILAGCLPKRRALSGLPIPAFTRVLAPSQTRPATVYRPDERTLVVRPPEGFLRLSFDQLARSLEHPMIVGQRVELTGMTAEVLTLTADGRPDQVSFTFDVPLEDSSLRWIWWDKGGFVPFVPPPVGEMVELLQGEVNK